MFKAINKQKNKYYKYGDVLNGTIVGSPTVQGTVISGFSSSNYFRLPLNFNVSAGQSWEMVYKVTTGTDVSTLQSICGHISGDTNDPVTLEVTGGHFRLVCHVTKSTQICAISGTYTVLPNTTYWVKGAFTGTEYILSYSLDGKKFIEEGRATSSKVIWTANLALGRQTGFDANWIWKGSIDIKECYVKINGKYWWNGTLLEVGTSSDYDIVTVQYIYYTVKKNNKYYALKT